MQKKLIIKGLDKENSKFVPSWQITSNKLKKLLSSVIFEKKKTTET